MKKLLAVLLVLCVVLTGCSSGGGSEPETDDETESVVKVGMVSIGDENEGYSKAHMDGVEAAAAKYNAVVTYKKNAGDGDQTTADKIEELIEDGNTILITNSYGHQSYTAQVAADYPELTFVAMTGDNCASSGLDNLSNAFNRIFEARYVAGVVAGLKLQELIDNDKIEAGSIVTAEEAAKYQAANPGSPTQEGNIKIGYVSAFPYAECISGFSSFYLGVRSVVENVTMLVRYTGSWGDYDLENKAATALISDGAVIISQHADTTGTPKAVEAAHQDGKEVYVVGYNISMLEAAPESALTSATNNWDVAYSYIIENAIAGNKLRDYSAGYSEGAVQITELGKNCAAGTAEKVKEVEDAIKAGTLHVFDVSTFTVGGAEPTDENSIDAFFGTTEKAIYDGYFHESELRSAPYFAASIDGIVDIAALAN